MASTSRASPILGGLSTFDLWKQIAGFLAAYPNFSAPAALVFHEAARATDVLDALARLLAIPAFTSRLSTDFRPLLMDLCARWLRMDELDDARVFEAFASLIGVHEEIHPIMCEYFSHPKRAEGPLSFIIGSVPDQLPSRPLHRILLAYYRILRVDELLPTQFSWPLSPLASLINMPHPDPGVRFLAIRCYALQAGMTEHNRERVEISALGTLGGIDMPIECGEHMIDDILRSEEIDGWNLTFLEEQRILQGRKALLDPPDFFTADTPQLSSSDLCPHIVSIADILLFRKDTSLPPPSPLVHTAATTDSLRSLALHISQRLPALLTSPAGGAGKTLLLRYLAQQLYPSAKSQVVTLHLADTSIDPKSLLGSYVSSSTTVGTFQWVEGVLTAALREGKWLVLEDIDKASSEVLGTIIPLVESLGPSVRVGTPASVNIPGKGKVMAREGFALFATRSVAVSIQTLEPSSPATFLGHQHWSETVIRSPSASEQEAILSAQFPRLAGAPIRALVLVFDAIQRAQLALTSPKGRDAGLRDLVKWTQRVNELLPAGFPNRSDAMDLDGFHGGSDAPASEVFSNPTIKELIFLETQDIFFGSSSPHAYAHAATVSSIIAEHLGLSSDRAEWVLNSRTPELEVEKSPHDERILSVRIGRTRLSAAPRASLVQLPAAGDSGMRPFAIHRPSLLLLEKLAIAVRLSEPLLLVGETGTGKTSTIQHLASLLSHPLTVINLSNQTEASDLLGGFKPLDARVPVAGLQQRFSDLFSGTFSLRRNVEYGDAVRKAIHAGKWKRVVALWRDATSKAVARIQDSARHADLDSDAPRKRRRVEGPLDVPSVTELEWNQFEADVSIFEAQHVLVKTKLAFSFVEGPLVRALRAGHWVLLDEMNLASAETLEAIAPLLHSSSSSLTLAEQGSLEPVPRHPSFRLFASMNPATDVGKKDLPPVLRSNFTEVWVPPPDTVREALLAIVQQYIGHIALSDRSSILDVTEYYEAVRKLAESRQISDGSNRRPHFSMRTLTRALTFASDVASTFGLRRALWEGCLMSFTMTLDSLSAEALRPLAEKHLLSGVKNKRALLSQTPTLPPGAASRDGYVQVGPFFLRQGPLPLETTDEYILTPSVQSKLIDLSRIILTRRFPVLIEGPTSAGKTSSIEYLARRTGHRFVRINNHEHTDIQEYIGTYISDPTTGKLVFQDGILVRALRRGDWIVLDELNLAPTDVLEALNRLLDDNRELLIPETQEIIKPHPNFMLFATQNPPGLYAGRKVLSRAFRNRFLEVHFDDVPQAELETILCQRCRIAPSYAQRIVAVFRELQKRRQAGRVFESKHGFATLRDLFRWAGRDAVGYQQLAENGYMLLAERARRPDDKKAVKEAIEGVMKVTVDPATLYVKDVEGSPAQRLGLPTGQPSELVWTSAFRRLFILVASAIKHHEPVLLVGDTGTGKTSVCQYLAEVLGRRLYILNCHQNTETADLLGGLRPVRNRAAMQSEACLIVASLLRHCGTDLEGVAVDDVDAYLALVDRVLHDKSLPADQTSSLREARRNLQQSGSLFEWHDGPLVNAMQGGDIFLLDEISLADDSVLERLNSVLEPSRSLVLAEKGGHDVDQVLVNARPGFELVSTMNPGGDYGKKELSPALRNRFTEIWVPQVDDRQDRKAIVDSMWQHPSLCSFSDPLLDFAQWMAMETGDNNVIGLRDITAWVTFSNHLDDKYKDELSATIIFHHAAHMTTLDGLGSLSQLSSFGPEALSSLKRRAVDELHRLVPLSSDAASLTVSDTAHGTTTFSIGPFAISLGPIPIQDGSFNIDAPTARHNAMRILRACQVRKPILLEGSPGVGKTSLITALAALTGHSLCRVNLSDQTDIMDLFGSDLPVEGGRPGEFQWKDAAFLRALQNGDWVLLDEMNLAPQAVLEGLNAILDHRGSVYLPELGRTFIRHPEFRIFAAQNPLQQGGGRKGLPKSFLNRFTKVYLQELDATDMLLICQSAFPSHPVDMLKSMITFTNRIQDEVTVKHTIGRDGGPWEFNLRDILRWMSLMHTPTGLEINDDPATHLDTIFLQRFRSMDDRRHVVSIFNDIFSECPVQMDIRPWPSITPEYVQIGYALLPRHPSRSVRPQHHLLQGQLAALQAAGVCTQHGWLVILTGPSGTGKTSLASLLSDIGGFHLEVLSMNGSIDTTDLLGGFEQVDLTSRVRQFARRVLTTWDTMSASSVMSSSAPPVNEIDFLRKALADTRSPLSSATVILQHARVACQSLDDNTRQELFAEVDALSGDSRLPGRFDWVDGPLVSAMKAGHWMLLDNANLCNPAVLDRLNSLCEPNGSLTLSERGLVDGEVQILRPHPTFRLLMTVDPRHGELSRAMRNRGLEIALYSPSEPEDLSRLSMVLRSAVVISTEPRHKHVLSFQLSRRGLTRHPPQRSPSLLRRSFSGALGGIDITTRIATLNADVCVLPASSSSLEALILHHVRNSSPDNWDRVVRTIPDALKCLSPTECVEVPRVLAQIRSSSLFAFIAASRQAGIRSVSSSFYLAQPLDANINPNLSGNIPFLAFELVVRTAVSGGSFLDVSPTSILGKSLLISKRKSMTSEVHPVVQWLAPLILSARAAAQHLLRISEVQSEDTHSTLLAASSLLDYSDQLRDIGLQRDLDLTAVRLIVSWFLNLIRENNTTPNDVQRLVESIHMATLLKTGHCMGEIWSAFLPLCIAPEVSVQISRLNVLATAVKANPTSHVVRTRLLEVMSMLVLHPSTNVTEKNDIVHLAQDISNKQESDVPGALNPMSALDVTCLLLAQLDVISAQPRSLYDANRSRFLVSMACQIPATDLSRFIPLQIALWKWDMASGEDHGFHERTSLVIDWEKNIWTLPGDHKEMRDGPANLMRPVALMCSISASDLSSSRLDDLLLFESIVRRQHSYTMLQCHDGHRSRQQQLLGLFFDQVLIVIHIVKGIYPESVLSRMESIAAMCHSGINHADVLEFSTLLQRTENFFIKEAFLTHLCPVLNQVGGADSSNSLWKWLGDAWISLSLCLIHLYVPDAPLDPLVVQECERNHFLLVQSRLRTQMQVIRNMEGLVTGNDSNKLLHELGRRLLHVEDRLSSVGLSPVHRVSDITRLNSLFAEISQFSAQIISRLPSLSPNDPHPETSWASNTEAVLQGSISGFIQRLESGYPDLHDIVHPLLWSLHQLRIGLRIGMYARQMPAGGEQEKMVRALLAFPSVEAVRRSRLVASTAASIPGVEWILHCIAGINYEAVVGSKLENQSLELKRHYDDMLSLWLQDRERERQEMIDSSGLYRQHKHDETIVNDAEAEEQDFRRMFPRFEDESLPISHIATQATSAARYVSAPQMLELIRLHGSLFQSSRYLHHTSLASYKNRRRLVMQRQCTEGQLAALSPILDDISLTWRLSLLSDRMATLDATDLDHTKSYDFYADSNVPEVRKAILVLKDFRARVQSIILEWPDQMVLQTLLERAQTILDVGIQTPVAGVLASLERLLMHTDDWETYANRENTLKPQQQRIIDLIVSWRRLELRCWAQLLAVQEQMFIDGISEWWFRLYELLVPGTIAASETARNGDTRALDEHVSRLTPLVDEYMTSSPLGQFRPRLELLQSFVRYMDLIALTSEKYHSTALRRLTSIVNSFAMHYEYALSAITDDLARRRAPLEKEIRDYIKLASWKDVNVLALKQSAERTHRQLHKCIRKFRDILREPISPLFLPRVTVDDTNMEDREPAERPHPILELSALPPFESRGDVPKHLEHLSLTLDRFTNVLGDDVLGSLNEEAPNLVDAFATQVITTAQSLANAPITGSAEEKQKVTKTLVMRKRRALMDLLKEMKRVGVSPNLKPDVLARQQSRSHLLECGVSVDGFDPNLDAAVKKGNLYYHRLINGLQFIRDAMRSHHSDLSTRELQRTLMFTESTFSYGYSTRQTFLRAKDCFIHLHRVSDRLRSVSSDPSGGIARVGHTAVAQVEDTALVLGKFANALQEMMVECHVYDKTRGHEAPLSVIVTGRLRDHLDATEAFKMQLFGLREKVSMSLGGLLLHSEETLVRACQNHIQFSCELLLESVSEEPRIRHLCQPIHDWLQNVSASDLEPLYGPPRSHLEDDVINPLLVVAQELRGWARTTKARQEQDGQNFLRHKSTSLDEAFRLLQFDIIRSRVDTFLENLTRQPSSVHAGFKTHETSIARIRPFLETYVNVMHAFMVDASAWMKSVFKLAYVVCSIVQTLAEKGFCKPPEGAPPTDGTESSQTLEGTGLGDGAGAEDISKDIEEESQVEGLKGEDTAPPPKGDDQSDEQDAIEMSQDFDGAMEDVDQPKGDENEDDSDEESQPDAEDQIGDVDPTDPGAVDEKLWGDESPPEQSSDGRTDEDRSTQKPTKESEIVAKENEVYPKEMKKDGPEQEVDDTVKDNDDTGDQEPEGIDETPPTAPDAGAKLDDHVKDADTLDLPDDMNLDQDNVDGEADEDVDHREEADAAPDTEMEPSTTEDVLQDQEEPERGESKHDDDAVEDVTEDGGPDPQASAVVDEETKSDLSHEDEDDDRRVEQPRSKPVVTDGVQAADSMDHTDGAANDGLSTQDNLDGNNPASGVTAQQQTNDQHSKTENPLTADPSTANEISQDVNGDDQHGTAMAQPGFSESNGPQEQNTPIPNPLRSLGDALKEIRCRFDDIAERREDVTLSESTANRTDEDKEASQLEYIGPEDHDQDMQALGPSGDDAEASRLRDLRITDEEKKPDETHAPSADLEMATVPEMPHEPASMLLHPKSSYRDSTDKQLEGALTESQVRDRSSEGGLADDQTPSNMERLPQASPHEPPTDEYVELRLREWQVSGQPDPHAHELWRLYESLTHDLAYALCEQLRLILEPTLATRLKGDYRTGKRLNMKKIIPYIASEYTKDKIWLRRTRPSKREYQILIALDDSKSMREGRADHLAFETMALVVKALGRLEAGDVGIVKFGETVDILHGFQSAGGTDFTDQDGAKVMRSFKFDQRATNVLSLIERSLTVLTEARDRRSGSSSTAADLWQLEIIISDGICQEHDKLRTALRRAAEQRVMIVFIIVDALRDTSSTDNPSKTTTLPTSNSILSMNQAQYTLVNGKMELQMQRYLDTFPFEFYVVLRNVDALPSVLAGTLKQFFERISED